MIDGPRRAACQGLNVDAFYHPSGERLGYRKRRVALAKSICAGCPVKTDCLTEALEFEAASSTSYRFGVWGGKTPEERRRMADA